MSDFAKFADLLNTCFFTSGQVIEDIRKLYKSIEDKNREGKKNKDAILVELSKRINEYPETSLNRGADSIQLRDYLSSNPEYIPYWVRAYNACSYIASELELVEKFQFIAVSVDDVDKNNNKNKAGKTYSVLIDKAGKAYPLKEFGQHGEKNIPNRTFAKMFYDLASHAETQGHTAIGSYWSVRVTSSKDGSGSGNWLELQLGKNEDGNYDRLVKMCLPGEPFPEVDHGSVTKFVGWWCLGSSDASIPIGEPCVQIESYTKQIRKYFQESDKNKGIEGLICLSPFWAPSKEDDGAIASIYWAFSEALEADQIKIIQALTQILLGGVAPIVKQTLMDRQRRNDLERAEEVLHLLQKPLLDLSQALNATQEHTQELRAILYDPSHAIFSVAPSVMKYFNDNDMVGEGSLKWETVHNVHATQTEAAVLKKMLAAIICEIFGKLTKWPNDDGELIHRAEVALRGTASSFKYLRSACQDIIGDEVIHLFHDEGSEEDKLKLADAVYRFKQILHRPYKPATRKDTRYAAYPFEPLFVCLYSGDNPPNVSVSLNTETSVEFLSLDKAMKWGRLLQRDSIHQADLFPAPLRPPVPLYSYWLALLLGVKAYARSEKSAHPETAKISVSSSQMLVEIKFSGEVFDDCNELFREMKEICGKRDSFHTKGNFQKPFFDFIRLADKNSNCTSLDNKFSIEHLQDGTDGHLRTSIELNGNTFKYQCSMISEDGTIDSIPAPALSDNVDQPDNEVLLKPEPKWGSGCVFAYFNHNDNPRIKLFFETLKIQRLKEMPIQILEEGAIHWQILVTGKDSPITEKENLVCFVHAGSPTEWINLCNSNPNNIHVYFMSSEPQREHRDWPLNVQIFSEKGWNSLTDANAQEFFDSIKKDHLGQ